MERAQQEALAVTFLVVPRAGAASSPATLQVTGHRLEAPAPVAVQDRFTSEETVPGVIDGAGPVSVTARIYGVNPGLWSVTGQLVTSSTSPRGARIRRRTPVAPGAWSWRHWSVRAVEPAPIQTCLGALATVGRTPAVVPYIWGPLAAVGILAALVLAGVIGARAHLPVWTLVMLSSTAVAVGLLGAKLWYIVDHRGRDRDRNGWCIQGLLTGISVVLIAGGRLVDLPLGAVLDTITPGLFVGMAIGRVGCFFAGCCSGRPTASRLGIWSSDRRVGMRRIPTQLLEASWTAAVGAVALMLTLNGPAHRNGALFVGATAAYTLVRQGILHLRVERRQSRARGHVAAAIAAVLLAGSIAVMAAVR